MEQLSRRTFTERTLGSLLTFSVLETLFSHDAFSSEVKPITAGWLRKLNDLSKQLKGTKLTQVQWQSQVESLFAQVTLPELLRFVDYEKLRKETVFRERGERSLKAKFPKVDGLPTELVFGHQVFGLKKGRSVVPHGHNNMATAFLILAGEFHGRHYDRLADEKEHILIRPTIDKSFGTGGFSTVSDNKDNVHWFKATSDEGFIFNIHVLGVVADRASGRVYLDPDGEKLSGGRIRAKKLRSSQAYQKYG